MPTETSMGCSSVFSHDAGVYSCNCPGLSAACPVRRYNCTGPALHRRGPVLVGVAWACGTCREEKPVLEETGQPLRSGDKLEEERGAECRRPRQRV